jgi:hypothetical protein
MAESRKHEKYMIHAVLVVSECNCVHQHSEFMHLCLQLYAFVLVAYARVFAAVCTNTESACTCVCSYMHYDKNACTRLCNHMHGDCEFMHMCSKRYALELGVHAQTHRST